MMDRRRVYRRLPIMREFRPQGPHEALMLGDLQLAVVGHVWCHGPCDVKTCRLALGEMPAGGRTGTPRIPTSTEDEGLLDHRWSVWMSLDFSLYEHFRPVVPAGVKGWGAAGELDLDKLRSLGRAR